MSEIKDEELYFVKSGPDQGFVLTDSDSDKIRRGLCLYPNILESGQY